MKTVSKSHIHDSNCSCSSCLYRSGSDRPSVTNLLLTGSRIDRLFYGKYLPLREKKLIDRLIRTRAVYDDIRTQLLLDNSESTTTKSNSKHVINSPENLGTNKSGTILKIVEMVDKNQLLNSKKLSDCCSCCSCSSKLHLHNKYIRKRMYKHAQPVYGHYNQMLARYGDTYSRKKGVRFKAKQIRSDPCTCTFKFSGLLKNRSKTILRKLRTEPKMPVDLQATTDEEISQKRNRAADLTQASYQHLKQSKVRVTDAMLDGIKTINESKTKVLNTLEPQTRKSIEKLRQYKKKINTQMNRKEKKAMLLKTDVNPTCLCPKTDLVSQIKKDSLIKFKDDLHKKKLKRDWECESDCIYTECNPEKCYLELKHKNHLGFNFGPERNLKEKQMKKTDDILSQTYKQIRAGEKKIKPVLRSQQTEEVKSRVKFTSAKVAQGKNVSKSKRHAQTCICEVESKEKTNLPMQTPATNKTIENTGMININKSSTIQNVLKQKGKRKEISSVITRDNSSRQAVRIGSSISFNIEFFKNRDKPMELLSKQKTKNNNVYYKHKNASIREHRHDVPKRHSRSSQSVTQTGEKNKKKSRKRLKRCFCTLKLKSRQKLKKISTRSFTTDRSVMTLNSFLLPCKLSECKEKDCKFTKHSYALKNIQTNANYAKNNEIPHLLPYECQPGICTPDYCDPHRCVKLVTVRNTRIRKRSVKCSCPPNSRKTKSTSSITSRSYASSKAKYIQSVIAYSRKPKHIRESIMRRHNYEKKVIPNKLDSRQAVRIGSTFSFNIEFYKDKFPHIEQPTKNINRVPKEVHKKKLNMRRDQNSSSATYIRDQSNIIKKDRKAIIKLEEKKRIKDKKPKMFTAETETDNNSTYDIIMLNRSTKMNQRDVKFLEPYECEPFVCIPGECDQHVCLERLRQRFKKIKNSGITTKPAIKAVGSNTAYTQISSKTIQVYSKPKLKHHKILMTPKMSTRPIKRMPNYMFSKRKLIRRIPENVKQAVKIGSSFSFNIEFSKNKSTSENWPTIKDKRTFKSNVTDETNKTDKLYSSYEDTQVKPKRRHKASMVRPLLKRCFCTLNLQKKHKEHLLRNTSYKSFKHKFLPPPVYTINVLTQEIKTRSYMKLVESKELNLNKLYFVTSRYKPKMFIQKNSSKFEQRAVRSNLSKDEISNNIQYKSYELLELIKNSSFYNKIYNSYFKTPNINISQSDVKYIEQIKLSSIHSEQNQSNNENHYFETSYCAMNFQINTNRFPVQRSKSLDIVTNSKMKIFSPFECEPGVCIPGKCNPHECQKIILKRTMKNKSTKYHKKYRNESNNSSKNTFRTKSTQNKNIYKKQVTDNLSEKNMFEGDNRVVRIGSTFNFNIEFSKSKKLRENNYDYKHLLSVQQNALVKKMPSNVKSTQLKREISKYVKSVGTKIKDQYHHDVLLQTGRGQVTNKVAATLPIKKRCFCTLKLHKKGKLYKKTKQHPRPMLQNGQKGIKIHTVSRAQNTKKVKPLKIDHHLGLFECVPNICDPGNCDPYRCLEKIRSRMSPYMENKRSATNMLVSKNKSISTFSRKNQSMSTPRKFQRQKADNFKTKLKSGRMQTSKQLVRIGSSFSFNIDFVRGERKRNDSDSITLKNYFKERKENNFTRKKSIVSTLPSIKNKDIQIQNVPEVASTMTESLIKRCFCIKKLQHDKKKQDKKKNIGLNLRKNANPSFFEKCLCWLKVKSFNTINKSENHKNAYLDKNTQNTMHSVKGIDRYECEPGICLPGYCNPDECAVRRNKLKRQSKSSETSLIHSHSIQTHVPTYMKNIKTQSFVSKKIKHQNINKSDILPSAKRLVRIESQFSFDIEFYKKNISGRSKTIAQPKFRKPRQNKTRVKKPSLDLKKNMISIRSKVSQTVPSTKSKVIETNKILKRCFCTLQLHNNSKDTNLTKNTEDNTKSSMPNNKKLSSAALLPYECKAKICIPYYCSRKECNKKIQTRKQQYKYKQQIENNIDGLPYECEPLTCVAGLCNPVQCMKKIKGKYNKRQKKINLGANNALGIRDAASTMRKAHVRSEMKTKLSKPLKYRNTQKLPPRKFVLSNPKQAITIGSTFSFDINFYKKNTPVSKKYENKSIKTNEQSVSRSPETIRSNKPFNSEISVKFGGQNQKRSTLTHYLKNCFCNFKLNRKENKVTDSKLVNEKIERHSNKYTVKNQHHTLQPFECEPNVCIPGFCNARECEKRIKKQLFQKFRQKSEIPILNKMSESDKVGYISMKSQTQGKTKQRPTIQEHKKISLLSKSQKPYQGAKDSKSLYCIGSTLSFEIELFKHRYPKNTCLQNEKYITGKKAANSQRESNVKLLHNKVSQRKKPKRLSKTASVKPTLKRCFCTLKLQKHPVNALKLSKDIKKVSNNKKREECISTKGTSCSEICPYTCDKQIQLQRKSRSTSSQVAKQTSDKYSGNKAKILKREPQNGFLNKIYDFSYQDNDGKRIVEVPRLANISDKQAVKISSNFSFNIDFYKQKVPKSKLTTLNRQGKPNIGKDKNVHTKSTLPNNRSSLAKTIYSKPKGAQTDNVLKKCFCISKLLNKESRIMKKNLKNWNRITYPQIEVRRVSVQQKSKIVSPQIYTKAEATPSKNIYKIENSAHSTCFFCPHYKENNFDKIETIYPFKFKKFNRHSSETLFSKPNLPKNKHSKVIVGKKKLTKKKSKIVINIANESNQIENGLRKKFKFNGVKTILNQCSKFFSPNKNKFQDNNVRDKKSPVLMSSCVSKKSKKYELKNPYNNETCSRECSYFRFPKHYSKKVDDGNTKRSGKVKNKHVTEYFSFKREDIRQNQDEYAYNKCDFAIRQMMKRKSIMYLRDYDDYGDKKEKNSPNFCKIYRQNITAICPRKIYFHYPQIVCYAAGDHLNLKKYKQFKPMKTDFDTFERESKKCKICLEKGVPRLNHKTYIKR